MHFIALGLAALVPCMVAWSGVRGVALRQLLGWSFHVHELWMLFEAGHYIMSG